MNKQQIEQFIAKNDILDLDKISYLGKGYVNDNYLLESGNNKFVLRIQRSDVPEQDSRLYNEYVIYSFLDKYKYPWVPKPVFFDKQKNILIITFVPGEKINYEKLSIKDLSKVASELVKINSFTMDQYKDFCQSRDFDFSPPQTPQQDFERFELTRFKYIKQHSNDEQIVDWIAKRLPKAQEFVNQYPLDKVCLIHGDLHSNILKDRNDFWFIDWEHGRLSYYNDLGYVLGDVFAYEQVKPALVKLYCQATGESKNILKFKMEYHQYTWGLGGVIWAYHRFIKMKNENKSSPEKYLEITKQRIKKFRPETKVKLKYK